MVEAKPILFARIPKALLELEFGTMREINLGQEIKKTEIDDYNIWNSQGCETNKDKQTGNSSWHRQNPATESKADSSTLLANWSIRNRE